MRSFWSDPYLWIHLAGIAALPIFLEICLLGLAAGDPLLPAVLELGFVAAVGIAPIFWMQWQRPFYIFSLLAIAIQPAQLTDEERRMLRFFKSQEVRVLTVIAPILLTIILWQLYKLAPLAAEVTPFSGRLVGLLVAASAFLGCNLFLQVPLSVVRVLLAGEAKFAAAEPYPLERVGQDFTVLGLRVKQILPAIAPPPQPVVVAKPEAAAETEKIPVVEAIASDAATVAAAVPTGEETATAEIAETETAENQVAVDEAVTVEAEVAPIPDQELETSPSEAETTPVGQPFPDLTEAETVTAAEISDVEEAIAPEATPEAEAASVIEEQAAEEVIEEMLAWESQDIQPDAQPDTEPGTPAESTSEPPHS
ncbi:low-complexity tail membrane protein [Leptolyngbya sp. FACHB-541]|uniref:low-complexity tail membrane protein n=1 Tax=Leptolyngbya sp. FACHB-541 TaxID=2692810 RepID=UPI001687DB3C|nr:low-complexity tail membrane protein [Leptolyngbya sp. FACHB-541]MBD2000044.1 low-complexity tail membrane protein [Leptolyngbya sp. FACHB-541]